MKPGNINGRQFSLLIQHATTFWIGALGFLKAIIWPVFVVYNLLEFFRL